MIEIVWDKKFKRIYKNWSRKYPDLVDSFKEKNEAVCGQPFPSILENAFFKRDSKRAMVIKNNL